MENKATEGVNLKQNMEDSIQSHDEETFSIEKTVEGLLNESVGKFTENLENLENPYSNTLENTSDTLVDTDDTFENPYLPGNINKVHADGTYDIDFEDGTMVLGVPEEHIRKAKKSNSKFSVDNKLDEVPGDNNFNDIIDKVDYITDKNFNELVNILMNDNALSTMLIDMINRNKYGNKYPSIMTKKNSNDTKSPKTFLYTNSYSSDEPKHNYEDDYEDDRERERFCSIS
tara:strand:+ start:4527 stop:5216 length:690 start_codon:yes stop_codon:yes gene_type:complete